MILFQEVWSKSHAKDIVEYCRSRGYAPAQTEQGGRSTGGLVFLYKAANWSVNKSVFSVFKRHASPFFIWQGDGISGKGVLALVLTRVKNGAAVVVATTHLQSQYGNYHYSEVRRAQIKELEVAIEALAPTALPIILAGDFNTMPADPVYSLLEQQWFDLTSEYRLGCEQESPAFCGTYFNDSLPNQWLDYVFVKRAPGLKVNGTVELIRNRRKDDPFSDHQGLQVDISITISSPLTRVFRQLLGEN